ncbi:uncharacterized protein LTR77_001181 [Saxophila tyrrhenica]|uniref:Cytochrome P450 n=1 Tax=Saxophila tyrrhenica TaxID=1690608 RepID=A0AAV9PMV5_9PEZI|nr:hypothetical protein LTR77_001181 [Saxophila tyrrhenica]
MTDFIPSRVRSDLGHQKRSSRHAVSRRLRSGTEGHHHRHHAKETVQSAIDLKPPITFDHILRRDKKDSDSSRRGSSTAQQQLDNNTNNVPPVPEKPIKPEDVAKAKKENERREEDLKESLKSVEEVGMSSTRQLDDTYYAILEKASMLRSTVSSLQQLADESQRMQSTFQEDTEKLEKDTEQSVQSLGQFEPQEKRINELVSKLEDARGRTNELNDQLESARLRVEAYEGRENEKVARRRVRLNITWATLLGVLMLVVSVLLAKNRRAVGKQLDGVSQRLVGLADVVDDVVAPISTRLRPSPMRQKYHDIPSLPRHWAFGNLKIIGEKCNPRAGRHPDYGFEEIWNDLDRPAAFMVDLAPVDKRSFLVVAEPSIAESATQPGDKFKYSLPKSDTMQALKPLIGKESIITAEAEEWRNLRKRFNKGFAPAHLHNLSPLIISKTEIFVKRIQDAAETGAVVPLKDFAQDLTTDIITQLAIEKDFESQSIPEGQSHKSSSGILTASRILSTLIATQGQGFDPVGFFDPVRRFKQWYYERLFDRELYSVLEKKLKQEQLQPKKRDVSTKAIVQLALADMEPTPALLWNTVAQIKSFLFAGQDTTATMIQWLCYELSKANHNPRNQEILKKLEDEHNAVFGSGAFSALEILRKPGQAEELLGSKIPYTTAFIRETLRLHPPAGTARIVPDADESNPPVSVNIEGRDARIDGLRVYNCQWLIHRNKKIWGPDADVFNPDRWLDEDFISKLPPGAWRPFERGPRNCIGQELALLEGKVVMAAVTRGLRFEKVGNTGLNGEKEVWGVANVTTVPVDGMTMRFHLKA